MGLYRKCFWETCIIEMAYRHIWPTFLNSMNKTYYHIHNFWHLHDLTFNYLFLIPCRSWTATSNLQQKLSNLLNYFSSCYTVCGMIISLAIMSFLKK